MSDQKIQVTATYVGSDQPLLRVFDANVDLDMVIVSRTEYAVKALLPLDLLISAVSGALLRKFILDPLLDPIVEKFDWKKAVERYLKPHQSFRLVIRLINEGLLLQSDEMHDRVITAEIWDTVNKTLEILQNERLEGEVTKVRFSIGKNNKLIICCYKDEQPICLIDRHYREVI
jgi:hypothetical protein